MRRRRFTAAEAARVGRALGERFRRFSPADLARGMGVELEHGRVRRATDVTHDDPRLTAKIALAHLRERSDYYDRLAIVESVPNPARRSRPMPRRRAYPNPYTISHDQTSIRFEGGRTYRFDDDATQHEAARYLAHDVKLAEHAGRRPPRGPHGLTPSTAAILLHFGRMWRRKRRACPPCAAPRRRSAPRPPSAPAAQQPYDALDALARLYGPA